MQQRLGRGPQAEAQLKERPPNPDPQVMMLLWGTGGSEEEDVLTEGTVEEGVYFLDIVGPFIYVGNLTHPRVTSS